MKSTEKNITIVGAGYVGYSLALLASKNYNVIILETDETKIEKINNQSSVIDDDDAFNYIESNSCKLKATNEVKLAFEDAEFILIAVPTNFNDITDSFDTSIVDSVISSALENNKNALIVIKSTIPIGHTARLNKQYNTDRIIFSPEFLREGNTIYDNLYPSRIIVGNENKKSVNFLNFLKSLSLKDDNQCMLVSSSEAESIKLFSNSYLAMRISYFNEIDSFALHHGFNSKNIIEGVSLDERIGNHYNNPSFGYGGYCLPKDTRQLLSDFKGVDQKLIKSIVESNVSRKDFISKYIINLKPKSIGIYRLTMKKDSFNYRSAAIFGIMDRIKDIPFFIYEPLIKEKEFNGIKVINDLEEFKNNSDIVIANRFSDDIKDIKNKVITRDIFESD
jgi:UDPglucose 6-dehydrogenase